MIVTQSAFAAGLLDPALPAPLGVRNPDGVPATKRFDVYRNNVTISLADALETAFPVIRAVVGDAFFRAMAGVYLRAHPPTSPLMMFYGDRMPGFLTGFAPAASLPYLPDVARLELALRQAYHAADATPIDPAQLGGLTEHSRLTLAPAVRLIRSDWPIHGIFCANTSEPGLKPQARPENVLITRKDFDPVLHDLNPQAADFMQAIIGGVPVGAAITKDFDLAPLLTLLLDNGAITAIH